MKDQAGPDVKAGAGDPGVTADLLPPEAVVTIRHDLRTLANHILGYSEMVMEQAEEEHLADILPRLQTVHATGKQVLALVNDALAPGRGEMPRAQLHTLGLDLRAPLNLLVGDCEALLQQARYPDLQVCVDDLEKIHGAAVRLVAFNTGRLLPADAALQAAALADANDAPSPAASTVAKAGAGSHVSAGVSAPGGWTTTRSTATC